MAEPNAIQLADIIAPSAPPPAPPPYGWIALGLTLLLIVTLLAARRLWQRNRARRTALTLIKQTEHALYQKNLEPRTAAFQAAQALRCANKNPGNNTLEWLTFLNALDQARYAAQPPSAQESVRLLAQTRDWIKTC